MNFKVGDVLIWNSNKDLPCSVVTVEGGNVELSWKSSIDNTYQTYVYAAHSLAEAINEGHAKLISYIPFAIFNFEGEVYQAQNPETAKKLLDMFEIKQGLDKQLAEFRK